MQMNSCFLYSIFSCLTMFNKNDVHLRIIHTIYVLKPHSMDVPRIIMVLYFIQLLKCMITYISFGSQTHSEEITPVRELGKKKNILALFSGFIASQRVNLTKTMYLMMYPHKIKCFLAVLMLVLLLGTHCFSLGCSLHLWFPLLMTVILHLKWTLV